jgi:hypothetical protein
MRILRYAVYFYLLANTLDFVSSLGMSAMFHETNPFQRNLLYEFDPVKSILVKTWATLLVSTFSYFVYQGLRKFNEGYAELAASVPFYYIGFEMLTAFGANVLVRLGFAVN